MMILTAAGRVVCVVVGCFFVMFSVAQTALVVVLCCFCHVAGCCKMLLPIIINITASTKYLEA